MSSKIEIHVHLVWGTWRRQPIISRELDPELYRLIGTKCVSLDDVPAVERYVREQKQHHALRAIEPSLEPDEQSLT
jgi:hypothetical protein